MIAKKDSSSLPYMLKYGYASMQQSRWVSLHHNAVNAMTSPSLGKDIRRFRTVQHGGIPQVNAPVAERTVQRSNGLM